MKKRAEPTRGEGAPRARLGTLLVRTLVPSFYGAALLAGFFSPSRGHSPVALGVCLTLFMAHFGWRVHGLVTGTQAQDVDRVEVGLLALLAVATSLEVPGVPLPWRPPAFAIILVSLASTVPLPGILSLPLVGLLSSPVGPDWRNDLAQRVPLLVSLELLALAVGLVVKFEKERNKRLQLSLEKFHIDRDHMSRGEGARPDERHDLARLDDTLYGHLQQIKETANAHAAILALRGPKRQLFIRELVSDSLSIREEGVLSLDGTTFQWILNNRKPLTTGRISDPARLGYYRGKVAVRSFLGVPLMEGDEVEGVLAVDSLREDAFTEGHLGTMQVACHHVMTVLKQERALGQSQREVRTFKALHDFSKRLGACTSPAELLDLVLQVVHERVQPEFSVVALVAEDGTLTIDTVGSEQWAQLDGRAFGVHEGLAGWVFSSRRYLHYGEVKERPKRPVFSKEIHLPDFPSLVITPLEASGEVLGVLCVGSTTPKAFDLANSQLFEILAQQGGQALLQIQSRALLNKLAATDELTGLANRRIFLERLADEVRRNQRYPTTLSLLVIDVDHFKKVNDRLGHPAGDEVLKRVAAALNGYARETDLAARHGGEEFALLLPQTTEDGARVVAERVRQGIEALRTEWEGKVVPIKVSIGVASLEPGADTPESLVGRADEALYEAKKMGRNRVVTYSEIREYKSWK